MKIAIAFEDLTEQRYQRLKTVTFWALVTVVLVFSIVFINSCIPEPANATEATPLFVAHTQIGKGEIGGNNRGFYVRQYLNGRENLPWCAGFVSYCLKKSGYKLPYILRAKDFLKYGKLVNSPQTGDLIVFSRQGGGHIGIIEKIEGNTITTIEGNTGIFPSQVRRIQYKKNNIPNLIAYVRIK